jgi:hypothetical protein
MLSHKIRRNTIMKKRFVLAGLLSICILFSVAVSSGNAAVGWYEQCVVVAVGSQSGLGLVRLKGGVSSLPENWYQLGTNTTEANQGLAVALTALSTGGTVGVAVDPAVGFNPVITAIVATP